MFTILCSYVVMPFSYIFVLTHHKYTMFQSINKNDSKTIVLSYSERELKQLGFHSNDDEIVINKKHFEVVSIVKNNGIFLLKVVPDAYEDILVKINNLVKSNG